MEEHDGKIKLDRSDLIHCPQRNFRWKQLIETAGPVGDQQLHWFRTYVDFTLQDDCIYFVAVLFASCFFGPF